MIRSSAGVLNTRSIVLTVSACLMLFSATVFADVTVTGQIAITRSSNGVFDPLDILAAYQRTSPGSQQLGATIFRPSTDPRTPSIQATIVSGGGPGYVSSASSAQRTTPQSTGRGRNFELRADASVLMRWTDFIVSGPSGGPAMMPISANILLEGTAGLASSTIANGDSQDPGRSGWGSSASAAFTLGINGVPNGNVWALSSMDGGPVTTFGSGLFANFQGSVRGTTPSVMVPVNIPFSIQMSLTTSAGVYSPEGAGGFISAFVDFAHTGSFDTTGSAFVLPAGYTINSASAGVTNNSYIVPAPSVGALLGLGGLVATRRRRQRNVSSHVR